MSHLHTPLAPLRWRTARHVCRVAAVALLPLVVASGSQAADGGGWEIAGRQGILRMVIVPAAAVGDRAAFDKQVAVLCAGQETCFVNFFSNSAGAPVTLPLPDAIANEPVALLRRSAKQGVDSFRWSCRLKRPDSDCF